MFANINQVEYSEQEVGKHSKKSKKEVTFRFLVNTTKDYEVVLKWSFTSGKQTVSVNGEEKALTKRAGASVLDCKFEHDGLQLQVIGCQKPPLKASRNYFRCFELLINGIIFSACPSVNEGAAALAAGTVAFEDNAESILDIFYPDYRKDTKKAMQANDPLPALPPSTTVTPSDDIFMMLEATPDEPNLLMLEQEEKDEKDLLAVGGSTGVNLNQQPAVDLLGF